MPRKTTRLTVSEEGRDKGKTFVLNELPADQAERWFIRALFAISKSDADVKPEMIAGGAATFAAWGIPALLQADYTDVEPLLDEMWQCIKYQHSPKVPLQNIADGENSPIEEVATRFALRVAVLQLHLGFFIAEASPTSDPAQGANEGSNTPTFLGSLVSWYHRALQRS
jgi:hypothetical protein